MSPDTPFRSPLHFHLTFSNSTVNYVGAIVFTIGCSVLVVNAVLSFLPYAGPNFHLPSEIIYVEGALSLMSNIFFLLGSAFAFVQIVNAKQADLFEADAKSRQGVSEEDMGIKNEKPVPTTQFHETISAPSEKNIRSIPDAVVVYEEDGEVKTEELTPMMGVYSQTPFTSTENLTAGYYDQDSSSESEDNDSRTGYLTPVTGIYAQTPAASTDNLTANYPQLNEKDLEDQPEATSYAPLPQELWRIMPSSHEIWVRSIHEIGFLATTIFFCSSLVYFSSSIASIVTIMHTGEISRWIRYPQLVAAVGFAVASVILMVQAQEQWWRPAWYRLRWYVNLLNLIGSAGFIFCACFGLVENVYWARYQFGMSYLWGSWAFLFGSVMQWYKSLSKHAAPRAKALTYDDDADGQKDLMF